jgi:hypothetical protein
MLHTCYHIVSNHNNEYVITSEEVQKRIAELNTNEENDIQIFQVFTEEDFDVDTIRLKELQIPPDKICVHQNLNVEELL